MLLNARKLIYPWFYQHFKGDIYFVRNISYPINVYHVDLRVLEIFVKHTETNKRVIVYHRDGKLYHDSSVYGNDILVIYECISNFNKMETYARPLEMFLSEVDREKYPDVTQKYRFEEISNWHFNECPSKIVENEEYDLCLLLAKLPNKDLKDVTIQDKNKNA